MSYLGVFFLLLGLVAQQASGINLRTMCRGHSAGTLLPNPQDCGSYYVCQSGPQIAYCSDGLHFDRVNKVCNWPDWANCKLEEIELDIPLEETLEVSLEDSVEDNLESSSVSESIEEQTPETKLETNQLASEGKDEGSSDESLDDGEHVNHYVKVPVANSIESERPAVQMPVINHENPIDLVKVPDAEVENSMDFGEKDAESDAKVPNPILTSANGSGEAEEVAGTDDLSKPTKNSSQILLLHMPIVNVHNLSAHAEAKLEKDGSPELSQDSNQVIAVHVPAIPIEAPKPIVNVHNSSADAASTKDNENSSLPASISNSAAELTNSTEIFENDAELEIVNSSLAIKQPAKVPNPILTGANGNEENIAIGEDLSRPTENTDEIAGLPTPIVNIHNLSAHVEAVVEKAVSSELSQDSNQIILVHIPAIQTATPKPIVNVHNSSAHTESIEGNENSSNLSQNSNQVQVPVMPVGSLNTIVNGIFSSEQDKVGLETLESVEMMEEQEETLSHATAEADLETDASSHSLESSGDQNQEVLVLVPAASKPIVNVHNPSAHAESIKDNENSLKPSQNFNHSIEVHVPVLAAEILNTTVNGNISNKQDKVDIERLESFEVREEHKEFSIEQEETLSHATAEADLETDASSHSLVSSGDQNQEVLVLVPAASKPIVNVHNPSAHAESIKDKENSLKPSQNSNHLIEVHVPVMPAESHNTIVNGNISNKQDKVDTETLERVDVIEEHVPIINAASVDEELSFEQEDTQSQDLHQEIEVHIPVIPMKVDSSIVNEQIPKPAGVIAVHVPVIPTEVASSIVNTVEVIQVHVPVLPMDATNSIVEKVDSVKKEGNQVIELPVVVLPDDTSKFIVNEPSSIAQTVEKVDLITSQKENQVIELPAPDFPVDLSIQIVNNFNSGPQIVEKINSERPKVNKVIEITAPVSPVDVSNSIANAANISPQTVEKVNSEKPQGNKVIELPVSVFAVDISNSIVNSPSITAQTIEKVDSVTAKKENQVIELSAPDFPVDASISIVNTFNIGPQTVEKVDSVIPTANQVIELAAPLFPVDTSNDIVNAANVIPQTVEKVNFGTASGNQVIELAAPLFPVDASNSIVNALNTAPQILEKVNFGTASGNQVIELAAPLFSVDASNSIVNALNTAPQIVEKVNFGTPSGNQVIELPAQDFSIDLSNIIVNTPNVATQREVVVEKITQPSKIPQPTSNEHQVIELEVPNYAVEIPNYIVNSALENVAISQPELVTVTTLKPPSIPIELQTSGLPAEVSNSIVNALNANSHAMAVVEKVNPQDWSMNSHQIIELPAEGQQAIVNAPTSLSQPESPALPAVVSTAIMNALNAVYMQEAAIEKVESSKGSLNGHKVIEIPGNFISSSEEADNEANLASSEEDLISNPTKSSEEILSNRQSSEEDQVLPASSSEEFETYQLSSEEYFNKPEKVHNTVADLQSSEVHHGYQSSEEDIVPAPVQTLPVLNQSSEEELAQSLEVHQNLPEAHQSTQEDAVFKPIETLPDSSQSSEEELDQSSDNDSALEPASKPNQSILEIDQSSEEDLAQNNVDKVQSQSNLTGVKGTLKGDSSEVLVSIQPSFQGDAGSPVKFPSNAEDTLVELNKPTPFDILDILKKPSAAADRPIASSQTQDSWTNQHTNLSVSMLSAAALKANATANGTLNRPIVGAYDTTTGQPTDVMSGYNSKKVQCIHDGLYFLPHPSSCQKYFICAYRNLHMHSCGDNLMWNYKREQCEQEIESRCFPKEYQLNKPQTLKPARENNSSTKVASTTTKSPLPTRTTQPTTVAATPSSEVRLPRCPLTRQVYLPSLDDCNKYYICIMGHPVLTSCPDNLHWDSVGRFCGFPKEVKCARYD